MRPPATAIARASLVVGVGLVLLAVALATPAAAATPVAGCTNITAPGSYTLTADVVDHNGSSCFTITASDVVLDGDGHTVDGTGDHAGIEAFGHAINVTVRNVVVTDWTSGVRYESVDDGRLEGIVARNTTYGLDLQSSNSYTVDGVTATDNEFGVRLDGSHNGVVTGSSFTGNANSGVHSPTSTLNVFTDLTVADNAIGLYLSDDNVLRDSEFRNNTQQAVAVTGSNNVIEGNTIVDTGITGLQLHTDAGASGPNRIADNYLNNTQNTNVGGLFADPGPNDWNVTPTAGTNVIGGPTVGGNFWASPDGTGFSQTCSDADADGLCDDPNQLDADNVDHHPLTAVNAPPTAAFDHSPASPTVNESVQFTAQATDPDGTVTAYAWDFDGDGVTDATSETPTHAFGALGDHVVTLNVTDDEGATNETAATVTVVDPNALTDCTVIDSAGTYRLAENLTVTTAAGETCLDIQASDVVLDGDGHALTNADGTRQGLAIATSQAGLANITVRNITVSNWIHGVTVRDESSATLVNVALTETSTAVEIVDNASAVIQRAAIADSSRGVWVGDDAHDVSTAVLKSSTVERSFGIFIDGSGSLVAEDNTLHRTGEAIHVAGGTLTARNNTITDASIGVAQWGGTATIENNTIRGADEEGILVAVGQGTVRGNTIVDSDDGIAVYSGTGPVADNTVTNASDVGIYLASTDSDDPADLVASGNTVTAIGDAGLLVGTNATVTGNTVERVSNTAVEVAENATAVVTSNHIDRTGLFGIAAQQHATIELQRNAINDTFRGIELGRGVDADIIDNRITHTDDDAVSIWGARTVTLTDTTVDDAGNFGLLVQAQDAATVANNTVNASVRSGIRAQSDELVVTNNTVTDAGEHGLLLYDGPTVDDVSVVSGNTVTSASQDAISVVTNATVTNNTLADSPTGVGIEADLNVTLRDNDLRRHEFGVDARGATTIRLDRNRIVDSTFPIHLQDVESMALVGNEVTRSADIAIVAWGGGTFEARDNVVTESANDGISANAVRETATLANNTVRHADGTALAASSPTVTVTGNAVEHATDHGVFVWANDDAVDATVADNAIRHVAPGNGAGDGITLTNVTATAHNNTVTDTSGAGLNVTAGTTAELVDNRVTDPGASRSGLHVTEATVTLTDNVVRATNRSDVTGIRIDGAEATLRDNAIAGVHTGLRTDTPETVSVQFNTFRNTTVAFENTDPARTLDATLNYLGPRGTLTTRLGGNVTAEPFLTAPPAAVDRDRVQAFGYGVRMPAGSVYALGAAAPFEHDLATAFNDFEGAIYHYDSTSQSWQLATGDETLDALDAVVVVPTTDATVVIDYADATVASPTSRQLDTGWQFVAPRVRDDAETAFSSGTVGTTDLLQLFDQPATTLSVTGDSFGRYQFTGEPAQAPVVSPVTGYFVYVDEPGPIPGSVPRGVSADQLEQLLGAED